MSGASPLPMPGDAAGGMMPGSTGGDADSDSDDQVVVTICSDGQGGYVVYQGDEPEMGGGSPDDGSEDDADAMGPAGAAPSGGAGGMAGAGADMGGGASSPGQPADSIGAALKIALDIMTAAKSSEGAPGNADDQLQAGFSASKSPTAATGPAQKY